MVIQDVPPPTFFGIEKDMRLIATGQDTGVRTQVIGDMLSVLGLIHVAMDLC